MAVKQESESTPKKKTKSLNSRNSLSENDLRTTGRYHEFLKTGLPPGITVDELWLYCRKRRPNQLPQDNLELLSGSYENITTEYRKHFKDFFNNPQTVYPIKPKDSLIVQNDGGFDEYQPEYRANFVQYPIVEARPRRFKTVCDSFRLIGDETGIGHESDISEIKSRYIRYSPIQRPPTLQKHPTNLKLDGDFLTTTTEYKEKFIQHLIEQRPLLRKLTTLKMDKMDDTAPIKTENREKFIKYDDYQQYRPPLCKKSTNLHLEGDLDILTEKQEKFIDYSSKLQQRPQLIKKLTNLRINSGEIDLLPEYRKEFIEYSNIERPKSIYPNDNLKTGGFTVDNKNDDLVSQMIHPQIPFLRDYHQQEHGKLDQTTNAYIESFNRKKTPLPTRRILQRNNLKIQEKIGADLPTERSVKKRAKFTSSSSEGELDYVGLETDAKPTFPRTRSLKHVPDLELEQHFECQPEYRRAYINYLQREHLERKPRPLEHLKSTAASAKQQRSSNEIETVIETPDENELNRRRQQRASSKKRDKKTLAQIETNLFGPKLGASAKQRRSPSALSSSSSTSTTAVIKQQQQRNCGGKARKFGKSVLVENLATMNEKSIQPRPLSTKTTTTIPLLNVTSRSKWMRDSSIESTQSTAFVVLDKEQINDVNNNRRHYNESFNEICLRGQRRKN